MLIIDYIVTQNRVKKTMEAETMVEKETKTIEIEIRADDGLYLVYDLIRSENPGKLRIAREIIRELFYNSRLSYNRYVVLKLDIERKLAEAEAIWEEIFPE